MSSDRYSHGKVWEPKFALSIFVKLGKIGNPKFPRGRGYLLNNTPSNQNRKNMLSIKLMNQKESKEDLIPNLRISV